MLGVILDPAYKLEPDGTDMVLRDSKVAVGPITEEEAGSIAPTATWPASRTPCAPSSRRNEPCPYHVPEGMGRPTFSRARVSLAIGLVLAACEPGLQSPSALPGSPRPPAAASPAGTNLPSPDRVPGTTRADEHGIRQVWVPGGVFVMGSEEASAEPPPWARVAFRSEQPAHEVALTSGYWLDATEVTVAAFAAFTDAGGYEDEALWSTEGRAWLERTVATVLPRACIEQQPEEPQVCVTWYEAEAYAAWRGGRLPTEAEWEFAARGPSSSIYPWGDAWDPARANLDGGTGPVAVGSYPDGASWVGAVDMAGNAMEWVADWWGATYYRDAPREDPTGPATGTIKIEKGGWWGPPDEAGAFIGRASFRLDEDPPTYSDQHIGFRIVRDD